MIVVCGETLIDLAPVGGKSEGVRTVPVDDAGSVASGGELWRALPGGSPANVAVALARLKTQTAMLARISIDPFGRILRDRLVREGVDLRYVVQADEPSTLAVVSFDDVGNASYSFYLEGTADWQWRTTELPEVFGPEVSAIHAGSMALMRPPGGPVLEAMLSRESKYRVISLDPNVRPVLSPDPLGYRQAVERWLRFAHLVRASVDDVRWLYPEAEPREVVERWLELGPLVVVLTLGADGAFGATRSGVRCEVGGLPVRVVDTIGAGDTFSGALLHRLEKENALSASRLAGLGADELEAAMRFAVAAAAVNCQRAGADPPREDEVAALLGVPGS